LQCYNIVTVMKNCKFRKKSFVYEMALFRTGTK
jgi:hypothetical protein